MKGAWFTLSDNQSTHLPDQLFMIFVIFVSAESEVFLVFIVYTFKIIVTGKIVQICNNSSPGSSSSWQSAQYFLMQLVTNSQTV